MNCLAYALLFWDKNPDQKIWYDNNHCINLPEGILITKFTPLETYGYRNIKNSFQGLLSLHEEKLLKKYFEIEN